MVVAEARPRTAEAVVGLSYTTTSTTRTTTPARVGRTSTGGSHDQGLILSDPSHAKTSPPSPASQLVSDLDAPKRNLTQQPPQPQEGNDQQQQQNGDQNQSNRGDANAQQQQQQRTISPPTIPRDTGDFGIDMPSLKSRKEDAESREDPYETDASPIGTQSDDGDDGEGDNGDCLCAPKVRPFNLAAGININIKSIAASAGFGAAAGNDITDAAAEVGSDNADSARRLLDHAFLRVLPLQHDANPEAVTKAPTPKTGSKEAAPAQDTSYLCDVSHWAYPNKVHYHVGISNLVREMLVPLRLDELSSLCAGIEDSETQRTHFPTPTRTLLVRVRPDRPSQATFRQIKAAVKAHSSTRKVFRCDATHFQAMIVNVKTPTRASQANADALDHSSSTDASSNSTTASNAPFLLDAQLSVANTSKLERILVLRVYHCDPKLHEKRHKQQQRQQHQADQSTLRSRNPWIHQLQDASRLVQASTLSRENRQSNNNNNNKMEDRVSVDLPLLSELGSKLYEASHRIVTGILDALLQADIAYHAETKWHISQDSPADDHYMKQVRRFLRAKEAAAALNENGGKNVAPATPKRRVHTADDDSCTSVYTDWSLDEYLSTLCHELQDEMQETQQTLHDFVDMLQPAMKRYKLNTSFVEFPVPPSCMSMEPAARLSTLVFPCQPNTKALALRKRNTMPTTVITDPHSLLFTDTDETSDASSLENDVGDAAVKDEAAKWETYNALMLEMLDYSHQIEQYQQYLIRKINKCSSVQAELASNVANKLATHAAANSSVSRSLGHFFHSRQVPLLRFVLKISSNNNDLSGHGNPNDGSNSDSTEDDAAALADAISDIPEYGKPASFFVPAPSEPLPPSCCCMVVTKRLMLCSISEDETLLLDIAKVRMTLYDLETVMVKDKGGNQWYLSPTNITASQLFGFLVSLQTLSGR